DQARDLFALFRHSLGEDKAPGIDRLYRLLGNAFDLTGQLLTLGPKRGNQRARLLVENPRQVLALGPERGNQCARLLVENPRHVIDALRKRAVDLVALANDVPR